MLRCCAVLVVVIAACGGRSPSQVGDAPVGDGPSGIDAPADAAVPVDAPCTSCAPLTTSWEHDYGGSGFGNLIEGVWVDAAGNTYVTGDFEGTIELGSGAVTGAGREDALVLVLDAATGALDSALHFGTAGDDYVLGIAVDGAGNMTVAGVFATGTLSLGGSAITGSAGDNAFVASFTAAGAHRWSRTLAG